MQVALTLVLMLYGWVHDQVVCFVCCKVKEWPLPGQRPYTRGNGIHVWCGIQVGSSIQVGTLYTGWEWYT